MQTECSIPECNKPLFARRWCAAHYTRWKRHGDPLKGSSPKIRNHLCGKEDCSEPHHANGLCQHHHWRQYKRPPTGVCSIEDCTQPAYRRGWCNTHYTHWYRNGNPLLTRGPGIAPRDWTDGQRFWAKVVKTDGCWERVGPYATFRVAGQDIGSHRYSWILHYGPIPEGMMVCHRCDNPPCVRPDHLFLGDAFDNMRDAAAKKRWAKQRR